MSKGKFASTNQKYFRELGSDTSSVWNFLEYFLRRQFAGKPGCCREKRANTYKHLHEIVLSFKGLSLKKERFSFLSLSLSLSLYFLQGYIQEFSSADHLPDELKNKEKEVFSNLEDVYEWHSR